MTLLPNQPDTVVRRRGMLARQPWIPTALSLVVAICLVVPESEIRAKAFKINLIVKNIKRSMI